MKFGLWIFLTICVGFLTSAFPQVKGKEDPVKRVFEVPVYPGTVPFNSNPKFQRWHAPFGTTLLVYRTADGGPLDKEKVISFYREALTNKGWEDHTFERQGDEGYLGLRINLLVDLPNQGRAHVAGTFYMWVAPRDGMYTILLDQWRYTSQNNQTSGSISTFDASLESIATKHGYRVQRVYSDGEWAKDFENEFLIDRVRFGLFAKESTGPHPRAD